MCNRCGPARQFTPLHCLRGLNVASPVHPVLLWRPAERVKRRTAPYPPQLPFVKAWILLFGLSSVPCQVWAAPDGLSEVAQLAEDLATIRHVASAASAGSPPPEPLPSVAGVPDLRAPDFVDRALRLPRGPPPPVPVSIEINNATQHTVPAALEEIPFSVWIGIPGYQPQVLQFQLGVPCDIEDALEATARQLKKIKPPFYDRLVAVKPQPFHTCAAAILTPDWASYTALSLVCLDLRDAVPGGVGPVVPVFVTRPTSRAELCREAGVYGIDGLNVFVGTDPLPIQEDESIVLANGCLVSFREPGTCPVSVNDIQWRLQFPRVWDVPAQFPKQAPGQTSLLLLHNTGTYLLRTKALADTPYEAVARFVGVDSASVTYHTPTGDALKNFVHKAVDVRGVVALVAKTDPVQTVVFLDLRQIGGGVRYAALEQPYILFVDLQGYAGRSPPPAWGVQVHGGQRQHDRLAVTTGDTLVFGFQFEEPDPLFWSPPSDPGDQDDDDADSDDGAGDEDADDSSGDSEATTRSRSRGRTDRAVPLRDPSSDPSYQGAADAVTFPFEGFRGWLGVPYSQHDPATSTAPGRGDVHSVDSAGTSPNVLSLPPGYVSLTQSPGHAVTRVTGLLPAGTADAFRIRIPEDFIDVLRVCLRSGFTWRPSDPESAVDRTVSPLRIAVAALLSRFLTEPAADTPAAQETLHALRRIAGAL